MNMSRIIVVAVIVAFIIGGAVFLWRKQQSKTPQEIPEPSEELSRLGLSEPFIINPLSHAFIQIFYQGSIIYIDPADPSDKINVFGLPKADYIFITHHHPDHWNKDFLRALRKEGTVIIGTAEVGKQGAAEFPSFRAINNGEELSFPNLTIKAFPAYNIARKDEKGEPYHPKGRDSGYLFILGERKLYVSGDTECVPELDQLQGQLDILFLPMNLPFTMPPEEAAECALRLKPKIVYPYHQDQQDPTIFEKKVKEASVPIEVRIYQLP